MKLIEWFLLGSLGLNFLWAFNYKKDYNSISLLNGIFLGFILGPFTFAFLIYKIIRERFYNE